MHDIVDLRSDTLTLPTPIMREAMARAEVGDDVWEEDPTVQRLEDLAARLTGKEAALFVSSGTQLPHRRPGPRQRAAELPAGCLARKVKIHQIGPGAIRCVTHKDVDREDIDRALDAVCEITKPW